MVKRAANEERPKPVGKGPGPDKRKFEKKSSREKDSKESMMGQKMLQGYAARQVAINSRTMHVATWWFCQFWNKNGPVYELGCQWSTSRYTTYALWLVIQMPKKVERGRREYGVQCRGRQGGKASFNIAGLRGYLGALST